VGGKVLGVSALLGKYDFLALGEAPNDKVAVAFALAWAARRNAESTSMRAFTREELAGIVNKMP